MSDPEIISFLDSRKQPSGAETYFRDQRDEQRLDANVAFYATRDSNPDAAGRANVLARELGLPADAVERNLSDVENRRQVQRARAVVARHPTIAAWARNPRNAAIARDDMGPLSRIAEAWEWLGNTASNISHSMDAGVYTITSGAYGAIRAPAENAVRYSPIAKAEEKFFGGSIEGMIANWATRQQQQGRSLRDAVRPKVDNFVAKSLLSGVESLPVSLGAAAAYATGYPMVGNALVAGTTAGDAYGDARDKGLSPARATVYGTAQGAVEYATEKLPLGQLGHDIAANTPFLKTLAKNLAAELPGEQVATVLQDLNEWATLNPDRPFSEYLRDRPKAALATLIATAAGVGGQVTLSTGSAKVVRGMAKSVRARQQAKQDAAFLDTLAKATAESKVRTRDADALADLMGQHAAGTRAEYAYIPADRDRDYFQPAGAACR